MIKSINAFILAMIMMVASGNFLINQSKQDERECNDKEM